MTSLIFFGMKWLWAIFSFGGKILDLVLMRKKNPELKKKKEADRDHKNRNEHEDMVEDASETDDLEELRRRASE